MSVQGQKTMERERATVGVSDHRILSGRYELGGVLGRGGMAEVYVGTDRVLGRRIAVKILADRFAKDNSFVARFRREAQSAAALNHPNVVSVFDTGSDDGTHFIVMEYVQGKTLSEILREGSALMPERAVEIAEGVAEALAFAHRAGIVHRDVKPGNIMLTRTGDVKVMDFGIARATTSESLTQTAPVLCAESNEVMPQATRPTTVLPAPTTEETDRRRRLIAAIVLGGILLIILVGLFLVAKNLLNTGNAVTVPDVRGKPLQVAED